MSASSPQPHPPRRAILASVGSVVALLAGVAGMMSAGVDLGFIEGRSGPVASRTAAPAPTAAPPPPDTATGAPVAQPSADPAPVGTGFAAHVSVPGGGPAGVWPTPAPSVAAPLGNLPSGHRVTVLCTGTGEVFQTFDGRYSTLWNFVEFEWAGQRVQGWIPDVILYTGQDTPTMGPC